MSMGEPEQAHQRGKVSAICIPFNLPDLTTELRGQSNTTNTQNAVVCGLFGKCRSRSYIHGYQVPNENQNFGRIVACKWTINMNVRGSGGHASTITPTSNPFTKPCTYTKLRS